MEKFKSEQDAATEIALLKQAMEHRDEQVADLRRKIDDLAKKMDGIAETLSEAKGGWRLLMMVGGASGAVGGAIHWFIQNVTLKVGP